MSRLALTCLIILCACASPGIPPGGPVDTQAPKLLKVTPDSGGTGVKPDAVVFRFDEVVSERPAGVASLDALFLISPQDGTPKVDWHRSEVAVRPRRGWKANTPYTVTMLPGMSDLRGNIRNTGATMVFSTGQTIPESHISGAVLNWGTGMVAPRAFVEARPTTDTTITYVTVGDSTGTFVFGHIPAGTYRLRGIIDDNNNRGLDPREAWDTATITLVDSLRTQLLAFAHDSIAPRLIGVTIRDTVTLELLFDRPFDPKQPLTAASVSIKTSDSTSIPIVSLTQQSSPRDTTALNLKVVPAPLRPIPPTSIIVRLGTPIRVATTLRVRAINIRSLDGVTGSTERVERVDPNPPKAAPPPPLPAPPPAAPPATIKR